MAESGSGGKTTGKSASTDNKSKSTGAADAAKQVAAASKSPESPAAKPADAASNPSESPAAKPADAASKPSASPAAKQADVASKPPESPAAKQASGAKKSQGSPAAKQADSSPASRRTRRPRRLTLVKSAAQVAAEAISEEHQPSTIILTSDHSVPETTASACALAEELELHYQVVDAGEFASTISNSRFYHPKVVISTEESTGFVVPLVRQVSPYTFFICLNNPRRPLNDFDMVLAPDYDLPRGHLRHAHVIKYRVGLSRMTEKKIAQVRQSSAARKLRLELPAPRFAVIIGEETPVFRLNADTAKVISGGLLNAIEQVKGSLMLVTSPGTPKSAVAVFEKLLGDGPHRFRAGKSQTLDDYNDFLGAATHLATTWESPGRMADLIAMRQSLYLLPLPRRILARVLGLDRSINKLHQVITKEDMGRVFKNDLSPFVPAPLQELSRIKPLVHEQVEPRLASVHHQPT